MTFLSLQGIIPSHGLGVRIIPEMDLCPDTQQPQKGFFLLHVNPDGLILTRLIQKSLDQM